MSLPEGYLPRKGDVLSIAGIVEHDIRADSVYIFVKVEGVSRSVALPADEPVPSVFLKRRTWREGEAVAHKNIERFFGEVVAMVGDHVVVKIGDGADKRGSTGGLRIFHCNELEPRIVTETVVVTGTTNGNLDGIYDVVEELGPKGPIAAVTDEIKKGEIEF